MFDWVLNRHVVLTDNHCFSNFETLKVGKISFTRESDMNWRINKKVKKMFLWTFFLWIYLEFFVHTGSHREIIIFSLVRQKNGLPL